MVKLPPPVSKKLAAELAANAKERMKDASGKKYVDKKLPEEAPPPPPKFGT